MSDLIQTKSKLKLKLQIILFWGILKKVSKPQIHQKDDFSIPLTTPSIFSLIWLYALSASDWEGTIWEAYIFEYNQDMQFKY